MRTPLAAIAVIALAAVFLTVLFSQSGSAANNTMNATAGHIYNTTLSAEVATGRWMGVYGLLDNSSGVPNYTNASGTISKQTLYYPSCKTSNNYLLASKASSINLTTLTPGLPAAVDAYLNATANQSDSGTSTFTNNSNYVLGTVTLNGVNVTYTKSYNSTSQFDVGLLNDTSSNQFVFITQVKPNATSFNNETVDYQIMLPVNPYSSNETYYFYTFLGPSCANCTLELRYGWNLISICATLVNNSIQATLTPIAGEYLYVLRWNGTSNDFNIYSPLSPVNPFDTFEANYSYFIYSLNASTTTFDIAGAPNPDMNITLYQLWNTPSWPYEFNVTVTNETQSIAGDWQYVMKWDNPTSEFNIYSVESVTNPFTQVFVGEGQFLYFRPVNGTLQYVRANLGG